ncbi:FeoB-associated Cys-rich membrane protein [Pedobacter sp. P351]|uniref:FeoB-associated Cys-rich membrane protein n=1 Tax=Pedobacter superstes TaxID=3133441 RepID=UPI00309E66DD
MGVQEVLVILLFTIALVYVGRIVYKNLQSKNGCSSGCGKCGVDFSDVRINDNTTTKSP